MIQELDSVVLKVDLPEYGLQKGNLGTAVLIYQGGKGYEAAVNLR